MKFIDAYAHQDGAAFLYGMLAQRPPEANISHRAMPGWNEHRAYLASRPHPVWFLIVDAAVADPVSNPSGIVGGIYLSKQREIGITILAEHQRKGYATKAIAMLREMFPGPMVANVAPRNEASNELFSKLGGRIIQWTYRLP